MASTTSFATTAGITKSAKQPCEYEKYLRSVFRFFRTCAREKIYSRKKSRRRVSNLRACSTTPSGGSPWDRPRCGCRRQQASPPRRASRTAQSGRRQEVRRTCSRGIAPTFRGKRSTDHTNGTEGQRNLSSEQLQCLLRQDPNSRMNSRRERACIINHA